MERAITTTNLFPNLAAKIVTPILPSKRERMKFYEYAYERAVTVRELRRLQQSV
jgi:hypothetical protein